MDGQEQHYDTETYAGDRADQVNRAQRNLPQEDRSTRAELEADVAVDQSARLAPHVRMGDDRVIGSPPNWEAMTSTELHAAATQRNSPDTADNLGRAFNDGGNRLAEAANRLLTAVAKLDAAWSGKAADAARGALIPLAESVGQAGVAAQLMGAQMARQTAAASEVRKLPPPQEFDYQSELRQALANPNPVAGMADMQAKKEQADAVKREQVAYLNAYTQTMSAVDSQTPSFIEPAASISGGDGSSSRITGGGIDYRGPAGDPHQGTAPAPGGPGRGVAMPGFGAPGDPAAGGDGENQEIAALPGFGTSGLNTGASGYAPGAPHTAPGLPGGIAPGAPAGAPGAGSGGFGNAFGSFGGPAAGGAPGRGPSAAAGLPGAAEAAGSGGRGAGPVAGAARAGAAGTGPMAGGRGGRKEEDEEHDRPSYLIEGDPEGAFGSDEPTAPPVIGQE
jgi:hypothetical protein